MHTAPPVAGAKFLRKWDGRTLAALFDYLRATMPANNPGYLADAEVADIVAYMLSSSGWRGSIARTASAVSREAFSGERISRE